MHHHSIHGITSSVVTLTAVSKAAITFILNISKYLLKWLCIQIYSYIYTNMFTFSQNWNLQWVYQDFLLWYNKNTPLATEISVSCQITTLVCFVHKPGSQQLLCYLYFFFRNLTLDSAIYIKGGILVNATTPLSYLCILESLILSTVFEYLSKYPQMIATLAARMPSLSEKHT